MPDEVRLRNVVEDDLPVFFAQQLDPEAVRMAEFPPRDREAFMVHWARILAEETTTVRTILSGGRVAGNVVSWEMAGLTLVGYWLGREFWGRGVATRALAQFLGVVSSRPLHARVTTSNSASTRVLEKCGFVAVPAASHRVRTTGWRKHCTGSTDGCAAGLPRSTTPVLPFAHNRTRSFSCNHTGQGVLMRNGPRVVRGFFAFLCAAALVGPVLAQTGVGVEIQDVEDNRVSTGKLWRLLELKLNLTGNDLEKIESARVVIREARDDQGNDLWEDRDQAEFLRREYNMGQLPVSLGSPARAAKTVRLSGTVELFVPSKDPNAVVKLPKALSKLDKPLDSRVLKAEKLSITLLSPKKYEEKQGAKKLDDAKIEEIRARGKEEGIDPEEIEAVIELAKAFQELGDVPLPEGAVILSGKEADLDRVVRVRVLAADGTEVSFPSRSTSTSGGETIMVLEPSEPPPADATLELTLLTKKAMMSVPFELAGIELP
jgi:RimJ/RimL family protein N-acetyltransferase